jgi:BirA family biotin operon repressor/biotin-[acetyl-CoA-carboxylase] ligase
LHIRTVPVTGSTNTDLLALARDGAPEATWLRADRQTGGRGRHGRVWESPPGNLYASTLVRLRPNDPPAPTLALAAAVALHEVVTAYGAPVQIKWPNDLLTRASAKADIQHGGSAGLLPGSHQGSTLMGALRRSTKRPNSPASSSNAPRTRW